MKIRRLSTRSSHFDAELKDLLALEAEQDASIVRTVVDILADIRQRGDAALLEYTRKFDHLDVHDAQHLELPQAELQAALASLSHEQRDALETAAARIRAFHERQRVEGWTYTEADGTVLGQRVTPLDRVGLYVPGGKAAYPSSVLMNAIPAKVAGVQELIMVVPTRVANATRWCWRLQPLPAWIGSLPLVGLRPLVHWRTARKPCRKSIKLLGRAMPMWPMPNAMFSVPSAST